MQFLRQHNWILIFSAAYIALSAFLIWRGDEYIVLFPFGLLAVYFALYHTEWTFLSLAFLSPLSINIEEYTESIGLFIPTEPILFGFMGLIILYQIKKPFVEPQLWRNPIVIALGFYLFWILITSITSTNPLISLKYMLARLWFIIPLILMGSHVFKNPRNIKAFLWLFTIGMCLVIIYTVFTHATYRFGEKESHWVMWPFFKDHTIYGALVAFVVPIAIGIYFSKKHPPLIQVVLMSCILISLIGLYFSYTRAAWLSVIIALIVLGLIHFKIKFSWLAFTSIFVGLILYFSWDTIQMELARNDSEHTTEEFGERLESAANVTTDASNLERINRWTCAIRMFEERPIFGFGPGTYAFEYARFQDPKNLTIISTNFGNLGNAHSEYLGPLAEMGFIGFLAMVFLVAAIFYKGITLYNSYPSEDKEMKVLILAMNLALVTYFFHGILNNFLDTDKAAVPIWGICAMFIALEIEMQKKLKMKN